MCFSPTASFVAGTALSGIGSVTVAKARSKWEIPFAAIPLLFGLQQLTEGVVWLSLNAPAVLKPASFVFMLFSHVLWPTFIPMSVALMEPKTWRRRLLYAFVAVGAVVSAYFLYFLAVEDVKTGVLNKSILYISPSFAVTFVLSPYSVATCVSCLFSSYRYANFFGVLTFLSAVAAYEFYDKTFISVWCFFAAVLSVVVYLHVARGKGVRA
jgi:hypothetical protein